MATAGVTTQFSSTSRTRDDPKRASSQRSSIIMKRVGTARNCVTKKRSAERCATQRAWLNPKM